MYDTATGTSCFEDSDIITVFVNPSPTVGITSNLFNNEMCSGEIPIFTANSAASSPTFDFFVNSNLEQSSSTNIFNPADYSLAISGGDLIEVIVTDGASCGSSIASLTMVENVITTAGTITTATTSVCMGEPIPPLTGTGATVSGTLTYQWQSRSLTTTYTDILGAISQNYTPTANLTTDTFFRRITISTLPSGSVCQEPSNIIQITVDAAPAANLTASINGVNLTAAATATICVRGSDLYRYGCSQRFV